MAAKKATLCKGDRGVLNFEFPLTPLTRPESPRYRTIPAGAHVTIIDFRKGDSRTSGDYIVEIDGYVGTHEVICEGVDAVEKD